MFDDWDPPLNTFTRMLNVLGMFNKLLGCYPVSKRLEGPESVKKARALTEPSVVTVSNTAEI